MSGSGSRLARHTRFLLERRQVTADALFFALVTTRRTRRPPTPRALARCAEHGLGEQVGGLSATFAVGGLGHGVSLVEVLTEGEPVFTGDGTRRCLLGVTSTRDQPRRASGQRFGASHHAESTETFPRRLGERLGERPWTARKACDDGRLR